MCIDYIEERNKEENRTCIIRYIEFVYSVYTDTTIS